MIALSHMWAIQTAAFVLYAVYIIHIFLCSLNTKISDIRKRRKAKDKFILTMLNLSMNSATTVLSRTLVKARQPNSTVMFSLLPKLVYYCRLHSLSALPYFTQPAYTLRVGGRSRLRARGCS